MTSAVPFVRTNSTTPAASVVPVIEEVPLKVPVPTRVAITEIPEIPLPKRSVTVAVTTVTDAVQNLVNPKQAECEKKWAEYSSSIKPASQEAMDKMKAEFMSSCLIGK